MLNSKTQTYNDGVVNIYKIDNIAAPGNMPKDGLLLKGEPLRYEERTVGMGRYWTAMQDNAKIALLLRTPLMRCISPQDVAIPSADGKQYKIVQVQYPKDVQPPSMDISLERLSANYDIS